MENYPWKVIENLVGFNVNDDILKLNNMYTGLHDKSKTKNTFMMSINSNSTEISKNKQNQSKDENTVWNESSKVDPSKPVVNIK